MFDAPENGNGGLAGDDRGTTELIAVVLLVGMAALGATGITMVAGGSVDDTRRTTESHRLQESFRSLDDEIGTVAHSDERVRTVEFDLPDDADGAVRREASGRFVVTVNNGSATRTLVDRTMGAVVYESDDRRYAYQMGGVWQGTGRGTTLVSAPNVVYRDGTLTFPAVDLEGDHWITDGQATVEKQRTVAPLTNVTAIEDTLVTVKIQSEYYVGWADYFRQRVHGAAVSVDHATSTVVVRLGYPDIDGEFYPGVVANGDVTVDNGGSSMYTEIRTSGTVLVGPGASVNCAAGSGSACVQSGGVDRTELDWGIRRKVARTKGSAPPAGIDGCTTSKTLTAGTYYSDGFLLSGCTLTIDLGQGNVSLVVDGNVGINERIEVVNGDVNGTCCYGRVYTTGDVAMAWGTAGVEVDSGNATRFQLYGTSETHFGMGQSPDGYDGVVYAPRDDPATGSNQAVAE